MPRMSNKFALSDIIENTAKMAQKHQKSSSALYDTNDDAQRNESASTLYNETCEH